MRFQVQEFQYVITNLKEQRFFHYLFGMILVLENRKNRI